MRLNVEKNAGKISDSRVPGLPAVTWILPRRNQSVLNAKSRRTEQLIELDTRKMEVATGLEPVKTGFADQRLGLFGIATKMKSCTQVIPKPVPKLPPQRLFTPNQVLVSY